MQFDKEAYKATLTRHSKAGTNPEDLLERYAITLPATNEQIAAQVKAVRAFWNQHANGNARFAKTAKWCKDRDGELKARLGGQLETIAWWQQRAAAEAKQAEAAVQRLTVSLREDYASLGAVTARNAAAYGSLQGLSAEHAISAARQAGLIVVDEKVQLPEQPPINTVQFNNLTQKLREAQVKTIPELLHPGSGTFKIVERYACTGKPALRLDKEAISEQKEATGKAINPVTTAKGEALATLSNALGGGVNLDAVALCHLVDLVKNAPPPAAKRELAGLGVEATDAAIIAALLDGRQKATQVNLADQVRKLLADGQLKEAEGQAAALPDGDDKSDLVKLIAASKQELGALLAKAEAARQASDEAEAEKYLQAARRISLSDAEDLLRQLPLAPPGAVSATGDAESVKVFWQRGPGHDESVVYVVARTEGRAPAAPGDGTQVYRGAEVECADSAAPAGRPVQYGVFATTEGRTPSRAGSVTVTAKPPVWNLRAETGIGTVSLHWQAKPEARVMVTRSPSGAAGGAPPVEVPVSGSSVQLADLPDGVTQLFAAVAVYRGAEGEELRSLPRTVTATPRGEAKPNDTLRITTSLAAGQTRVRASWKQIDSSEVRILQTVSDQPWPYGTVISPEEVRRGGTMLSGHVEVSGAERTLEVELPGGMHYLTPVSVGGTGIAVGRSRPTAIIDPVTNLIPTPFADHASIAWHWPGTVQLAEVSWRAQGDSDDDWESYVLSRAEYESKGGAQVPLGQRPVEIEVRAVITANGKRYPSAPVKDTVIKVMKTAIRYRVAGGGPFSGRAKKLTFTADEPCGGTAVRLIAVPGTIKPTRPTEGVTVFETTLSLTPGVPAEYRAELPKTIKKPYWVRCFVMSGPGRLVDPPVGDMKED
jgi:hypothetical protein